MNDKLRYGYSRLLNGLQNPQDGYNYLRSRVWGEMKLRINGEYIEPNDSRIIDHDWDVLIILDACRYDIMSSLDPFEQNIESTQSQAPATLPWFVKNFGHAKDKELEDIVYITANPQASSRHISATRFNHLEEVFNYAWDDNGNSVPPDIVTDRAIELSSQYRDSRLVVHYMQPHGPFLGTDFPQLSNDQYKSLREGEVSKELVVDTYRECLANVIREVKRLVKYMEGKVVITGDHGESFGENGIYGHPPWANTKKLLSVPWVELKGSGKDKAEFEKSEFSESSTIPIEKQLEHLGYK